jgi:putative sigma-54 modulation protein
MMELSIRSQHMKVDPALRDTIAFRLRFALSRFAKRIRLVDVQIADINGPRGGVDKRTRIAVHFVPTGTVLIEERDADAHVAVTRAFQRTARAVARAMKRRLGRRQAAALFRDGNPAEIRDSGRLDPAVPQNNRETNS